MHSFDVSLADWVFIQDHSGSDGSVFSPRDKGPRLGNGFLCQAPYLIYVLPGSIQTSLRFIKVTISIVRKFVGRKCHYDQLAFQETGKAGREVGSGLRVFGSLGLDSDYVHFLG